MTVLLMIIKIMSWKAEMQKKSRFFFKRQRNCSSIWFSVGPGLRVTGCQLPVTSNSQPAI